MLVILLFHFPGIKQAVCRIRRYYGEDNGYAPYHDSLDFHSLRIAGNEQSEQQRGNGADGDAETSARHMRVGLDAALHLLIRLLVRIRVGVVADGLVSGTSAALGPGPQLHSGKDDDRQHTS